MRPSKQRPPSRRGNADQHQHARIPAGARDAAAIICATRCRYPLWGNEAPTYAYCGEPALETSSYCPAHHARCYISKSEHGRPVRFYKF